MSDGTDERGRLARTIAPNPDYDPTVGVRKATVNVAANVVVSAAPATLIVTMLRYNGVDLWPESADPAATATIMSILMGIPRWIEDWFHMNVAEPRYRAKQEALATQQTQQQAATPPGGE